MNKPRIGIVIGTTRQGRFSERVAKWVRGLAVQRGDAEYELVDLREYPLPLFDWYEESKRTRRSPLEDVRSMEGLGACVWRDCCRPVRKRCDRSGR